MPEQNCECLYLSVKVWMTVKLNLFDKMTLCTLLLW